MKDTNVSYFLRGAELDAAEALKLKDGEPYEQKTQYPRHRRADAELEVGEGGVEKAQANDFSRAARVGVGPTAGHRQHERAGAAHRPDHGADEVDGDQRANGGKRDGENFSREPGAVDVRGFI